MFHFQCHQLKYSIVACLLNTGTLIQFFFGNEFIHFSIYSISPVIPVSNCFSYQLIIFIKKNEVNSPGINTCTFRNFPRLFALFHSGEYFSIQTINIPIKSVFLLIHSVPESIYFFKNKLSILNTSKNMSPT